MDVREAMVDALADEGGKERGSTKPGFKVCGMLLSLVTGPDESAP